MSGGFVVNKHYCSNRLIGISFFQADEKACCGLAVEKDGCCQDEQNVVLLKTKQAYEHHDQICFQSVAILTERPQLISFQPLLLISEEVGIHSRVKPPPKLPLFIMNQNFRL